MLITQWEYYKPPFETWSIPLVMPAQPAPDECRQKDKYACNPILIAFSGRKKASVAHLARLKKLYANSHGVNRCTDGSGWKSLPKGQAAARKLLWKYFLQRLPGVGEEAKRDSLGTEP